MNPNHSVDCVVNASPLGAQVHTPSKVFSPVGVEPQFSEAPNLNNSITSPPKNSV